MNTLKMQVISSAIESGVSLDCLENILTVKFPVNPVLLGTSVKIEKGEKQGVLTKVLYLSAFTMARKFGVKRNMCEYATKGCRGPCLGHTSGRLAMDSSQNAQVWKTLVFEFLPEQFYYMLSNELHKFRKYCTTKGKRCAVRLNGSSDINWREEYPDMFSTFYDIQFYDYTKNLSLALASTREYPVSQFNERDSRDSFPKNYHLTYSLTEEDSIEELQRVIRHGVNVAIVFVGVYSDSFHGIPVIDGDESDYRPDDPKGVIVGLTMKGSIAGKRSMVESGFARYAV
jgi:hypothetical protein